MGRGHQELLPHVALAYLLATCLAIFCVAAGADCLPQAAPMMTASRSGREDPFTGDPQAKTMGRRILKQEDAKDPGNSTEPEKEDAANLCARFPYAVSLRDFNDVHRCDGVLINHNWVVTAARCVDPNISTSAGGTPILVIGSCTLDSVASSHGEIEETLASDVIIHEKYTGAVADPFDIALVKLSRKSTHKPVGLPTNRGAKDNGSNFTALGWHAREDGVVGRELRGAIPVNVVEDGECLTGDLEGAKFGESMVCGKGATEEDLCEGSPGAALLRLFSPGGDISRGNPSLDVAVAIASFRDPMEECIDAKLPYVFTSLTFFRKWIDNSMKDPTRAREYMGPQLGETKVSRLALSEKEREAVDRQLWEASVAGDVDAVIAALESGAAVDVTLGNFGEKPLHVAASNGHSAVVRILLDANADVDATKSSGTTPLFVAAQNGHVGAVLALLGADADVSIARPSDGVTPLYKAAENGHLSIVLALLEAGSDPNRVDNLGDAPLHISSAAVGAPSEDIANALLNSGADIDARGIQGLTPLMRAAYYGNLGVLKILLIRGADEELRSDNGFSAADWICWCLRDAGDPSLVQCTPGGCEEPEVMENIEQVFA